jgi:predicted transcriptional regulator
VATTGNLETDIIELLKISGPLGFTVKGDLPQELQKRQISLESDWAARVEIQRERKMKIDQTVLQAKRFGVYSCSQDKALRDAAQRMVEEDISALAVVDAEGYLSGIITRTDLLRALVSCDDWEGQPVERFMNKEVVTVTPNTQLLKVAELLLDKQIHRVVVARDENGKKRPVSVVSAADLVYHMVKNN